MGLDDPVHILKRELRFPQVHPGEMAIEVGFDVVWVLFNPGVHDIEVAIGIIVQYFVEFLQLHLVGRLLHSPHRHSRLQSAAAEAFGNLSLRRCGHALHRRARMAEYNVCSPFVFCQCAAQPGSAVRRGGLYRLPMSTEAHDAHQAYLRKLCFRAARRGFLEADLILGPFALEQTPTMTAAELAEFEVLLDQPDQDLYGWIIGVKPTPEAFDTELMARICEFRFRAHAVRTGADH